MIKLRTDSKLKLSGKEQEEVDDYLKKVSKIISDNTNEEKLRKIRDEFMVFGFVTIPA